jgi:non-ribosomal peptide synthetase component F
VSTDPALLEVSLRSTLTGLIDEQTARTPEAVAVVTADGPLTYAELAAGPGIPGRPALLHAR